MNHETVRIASFHEMHPPITSASCRPSERIPPPGWTLLERRVISAMEPYRLDLTIAVLGRTIDNLVDRRTEDGTYLRAWLHHNTPLVTVVIQAPNTNDLVGSLYVPSVNRISEPYPSTAGFDFVRTLGTGVDLQDFHDAARDVPLLWPVVERARGVKPPRYPTLWEAICNAVVFQQISLQAAAAIMRRMVTGLSDPVQFGDIALYPFPEPKTLLATDATAMRGWGLSASKARALQEAADAIRTGRLREEEIETLPTGEAIERLTQERGVGRWTAAVVLLRGFRRLDVFPMGDSGARRGLRELLGEGYRGDDPDAVHVLEALGPWCGMLYYHLLLLRLAKRGEIRLDR